jgi:hypothetical protein
MAITALLIISDQSQRRYLLLMAIVISRPKWLHTDDTSHGDALEWCVLDVDDAWTTMVQQHHGSTKNVISKTSGRRDV